MNRHQKRAERKEQRAQRRKFQKVFESPSVTDINFRRITLRTKLDDLNLDDPCKAELCTAIGYAFDVWIGVDQLDDFGTCRDLWHYVRQQVQSKPLAQSMA